jgi:hypothetical protein
MTGKLPLWSCLEMSNLIRRTRTALVLSLLAVAAPALAHHSFSAFNRSEAAKRSVEGTVRDYQLINPHGWLKLVVPEGGGRSSNWSFEMASATQLQKQGWTPGLIRPGDKVTVTYFPLRFGSYGGQAVSVRLRDGRVLNGIAEADRGYPGQR